MADGNSGGSMPATRVASDLPKRAASAVIMLAVAAAAIWQGGDVLHGFIALVALVCFVELLLLVVRATGNVAYRLAGILAGALYVGLAALALARMPTSGVVAVVGVVICIDTFAYFFGRSIGGPKIAPRISPSKTWAGLLGGIVGATLWISALWLVPGRDQTSLAASLTDFGQVLLIGTVCAVAAQSGDFFESWLKRRAGVKDSSGLIPGHGGVFDRVDGLLPLALMAGLFGMFA